MAIDIRKDLKVMLPHLKKAQEDNLNEADTLMRIIKVLEWGMTDLPKLVESSRSKTGMLTWRSRLMVW